MSVAVGDVVTGRDIVVDAEKMKIMAALLEDPNPIHWDTRAVADLGLGDAPVNQGPLNMGYIQSMLAQWAGGRDRIREFRVRFLGNVFGGQTVRAGAEVTAVVQGPEGQRIDCEIWLDVDGVGRVMSGTATVIMDK
ncbi:MaoC family dehydratase [Gordonia sp. SL306]|uniref:MaoC family dehydratase n=1 Tax=Gordonia sp. SL306 TaxID=2995145 RepID=UPI00226DD2BD|nr:MaoC family dehydratase [Gordonia sp. SL306]WAC56571.1 MaoC family dehydratase [Gordonia sp. SL306]